MHNICYEKFNCLIPGGNKRQYILKQRNAYLMRSYLSTYDLFLSPVIKGLINYK